jgi:hypothetical protein
MRTAGNRLQASPKVCQSVGGQKRWLNSSLIYKPPAANVAVQTIVRDLAGEAETMVGEFREAEQQHIGHARPEAAGSGIVIR